MGILGAHWVSSRSAFGGVRIPPPPHFLDLGVSNAGNQIKEAQRERQQSVSVCVYVVLMWLSKRHRLTEIEIGLTSSYTSYLLSCGITLSFCHHVNEEQQVCCNLMAVKDRDGYIYTLVQMN